MQIAFFEVDPWQQAYLKRSFPDATYEEGPLTLEKASAYTAVEIVAVRTRTRVTDELLAALPALKLLLTMTTGADHIDLDACKRHGIATCNVTGYGDAAVAEHVFALLLALAKNLPSSSMKVCEGKLTGAQQQGFELHGKTLGILGCGAIGLHAAKIANGFGMTVLVYDIVHHDDWAAEYGFTYVALDELLSKSEVLTLHVPLNTHTRGLMGKDAFAKMKDGSVLLNTSRGEVVDTTALIGALESGKLRGAGLDVLDDEDFTPDHEPTPVEQRLCGFSNVILTPHNAYNSVEALTKRLDMTVANIRAFSEKGVQGLKDQIA